MFNYYSAKYLSFEVFPKIITMCCLFFVLCQHHRQHHHVAYSNRRSAATKLFPLFNTALLLVLVNFLSLSNAQIAYTGYMSELRIQELHNMAIRLEHSIDMDKFACESYFDYVCGRNRPLFSILGHLPETNEVIQLLTELQNDSNQFEAKQKLMDFFISCNTVKGLEDCYRESFEYFKPLFVYIITKNYIDSASHEHNNFLEILTEFVKKAEDTENFGRNPIRLKLASLKEKFKTPQIYFRTGDLDYEYESLKMYRESYQHNIRNLEIFRKRNSTYEYGPHRTILDWSLYVYQSRNKPMSYYYATLNVHLWMTLFNTTERYYEPKRFAEIVECLKLPQFVNVLEEARILAVVYLKSFRNALADYNDWRAVSAKNQEIFDRENEILKQYNLNNNKIFFTLYGQNFCEFGKDLAENVFYLGLKHTQEFFHTYSCGYQTERNVRCI
ncbi:uncharacterized protein LOC119601575 [Lucilia sericata]|uniref:uncharacterized protein LOC119601575 n=1 Tax=Lucilia sericata TaxID=13632 RepID=UPI0018A81ED4|nr:uncharacterized protein LOC119601575 [Lucilia sericata]XP_037808518.1 uncharacterized protein LOC119601575 [Lucilia sericata]